MMRSRTHRFDPLGSILPLTLIALIAWLGCDTSSRIRDLESGDKERQLEAAQYFIEHPTPSASASLVRNLNDAKFPVRQACALAIGALEENIPAKEAAAKRMMDDALSMRQPESIQAIDALGALGGAALRPLMMIATVSPEREAQGASRKQIVNVVDDANANQRLAAVQELFSALDESDAEMVAVAYNVLLFVVKKLRPELVEQGLTHPQRTVRRAIIIAMGEFSDPEFAPDIVPLLEDADAGVRREAVLVLGILKNPVAEEELQYMALRDPNKAVREAAQVALDEIQNARRY